MSYVSTTVLGNMCAMTIHFFDPRTQCFAEKKKLPSRNLKMCMSVTDYDKYLKEFVSLWNATFPEDEQWNLRQTADGTTYADTKYFDSSSNLWLQAFIIFSDSYDTPVLWFNAYEPGAGLQKRLPLESAVRTTSEAAKCSEGEHPVLGIGFYYVDPCRINAATKALFVLFSDRKAKF
uniref:Autophagy_act_C domain-containing protein n=1 Tax=Panagrellus redivivus TaxID=6233 RepID=A0A7E4W0J7_PANRE